MKYVNIVETVGLTRDIMKILHVILKGKFLSLSGKSESSATYYDYNKNARKT